MPSKSWKIKSARSYAGEMGMSFKSAYTKLFGKRDYESIKKYIKQR